MPEDFRVRMSQFFTETDFVPARVNGFRKEIYASPSGYKVFGEFLREFRESAAGKGSLALGVALWIEGSLREAEELLAKVPASAVMKFYLGRVLLDKGRYVQALECFNSIDTLAKSEFELAVAKTCARRGL